MTVLFGADVYVLVAFAIALLVQQGYGHRIPSVAYPSRAELRAIAAEWWARGALWVRGYTPARGPLLAKERPGRP